MPATTSGKRNDHKENLYWSGDMRSGVGGLPRLGGGGVEKLVPSLKNFGPDVMQSGFGVIFLFWSGEFRNIAGEFLSEF